MKMRMLALGAAVLAVSAQAAAAETWIAICNDGQGIQYNQTIDGGGFMYMNVDMDDGSRSTYQIARLEQTFYNGTAVCGAVTGNGVGDDGTPITQLCANQSRNIIYVRYKHPYEDRPMVSGVFCTANVMVRD